MKYNTTGTAQWATRIGGSGSDQGMGTSTDSNGNVYVTGYFTSNPLTIYNYDGSTFGTLTNSGSNDCFIVKYNTTGTAQWATRIGGSGSDQGMGTSTDSNGNVYVTGYFTSNPLTIYNYDGSTFGTLTNSGSNDCFIVKYNTSGTAQWATRICGSGSDQGNGIATDSNGNVYVTGQYSSNPLTIYNYDGSTFGTLINSSSGSDCFIVKYNTTGTAQWATRMGGTYGIDVDLGTGIATDSNGNVYVTGYYYANPLTIYNYDGSTFGTLSKNGNNTDCFIVKYNTTGTAQWATRIAGPSTDRSNGIATDSNGNVYVTGYYSSNPLTIYNYDGSTFGTLPQGGTTDCFIVKYNTTGTAQWKMLIGGPGNNDRCNAIATDSNGYVYAIGQYNSNPLTIYNYDDSTFGTLSSSGSLSVFIVQI